MNFDLWSKAYSKLLKDYSKCYFDLIGTNTKVLLLVKKPLILDSLHQNSEEDIFGYYEPIFENNDYQSFLFQNVYIKYPQKFFIEGQRPTSLEYEEIRVFLNYEYLLKDGDYIIDLKENNQNDFIPIVLQITYIETYFIGKYQIRKIAYCSQILDYSNQILEHIEKFKQKWNSN